MEIQLNEDGEEKRFLFATSRVPKFSATGEFIPFGYMTRIEASPYYWWYRYIKLTPRIDAELNGMPVNPPTAPGIATALCHPGDLSFHEWWKLHIHLFAEPEDTSTVRIAHTPKEIAEFNHQTVANLVIPLDWPVSAILKLAKSVIEQEQKDRGIENFREIKAPHRSNAVYKLDSNIQISGLANAYKVYEAKRDFWVNSDNKKLTWLNVALEASLPSTHQISTSGIKNLDYLQKKVLEESALRNYRKACNYIKSSLTNKFPFNKDND